MDSNLMVWANSALTSLIGIAPKALAAAIILIVAYFIGKIVSRAVGGLIDRTPFGKSAAEKGQAIGASIGTALFWVIILIALPMALAQIGLAQAAEPIQNLVNKIMAFVPNLFGAGLIFFIGFVVATVVKYAIQSLLEAAQIDRLGAKLGLSSDGSGNGLAKSLAVLVFALILIPIAVSALDALEMASISEPAKAMLSQFLGFIPKVIASGVILGIAVLIGRFAQRTLAGILPATGVDNLPKSLGFAALNSGSPKISHMVGTASMLAILGFGLIEAAKVLDLGILSNALTIILGLLGNITLGGLIIAAGLTIAQFVSALFGKGGKSIIPGLVKTAIIFISVAMGLGQMGLAKEIVTLAVGLGLGSLAVGAAIAIGFGGQDAAKKLLGNLTKNL